MLFFLICIFVSTICYFNLPLSWGYKPSLAIVVFILSIQLLYLYKRKEIHDLLNRQYLRIFPVFMFSFICVHFQQFIDIFFGVGSFNYPEYSNQTLILHGAFLSLMGGSSLLFGYEFCAHTRKNIENPNFVAKINHKRLKPIFNWLFLGFTVLFIYLNGRAYMSGKYGQEMMSGMQGTMNAYSLILLQCSMYSATIENCKSLSLYGKDVSILSYTRSFSPIYYICLFIVLYFHFLLGDRGPLITYLLIYIFGFVIVTKRKINIVPIIIISSIFAIVFSVLAVYRTDENKSFSEFQNYQNSIIENESLSPFTAELAGSTYPTLLAIDSTPEIFPYRYGAFSLNNITAAIPFSSSLFSKLGLKTSILAYSHSSSFLTWYGHGGDMTRSGIGSSTVADVYLDFGPIGVIIVLFLLGYLIRYLDVMVFTKNILFIGDFVLILAFVMFANALYFPRSMVFFFVKDVVWAWAFYKGVCSLFGKYKK